MLIKSHVNKEPLKCRRGVKLPYKAYFNHTMISGTTLINCLLLRITVKTTCNDTDGVYVWS